MNANRISIVLVEPEIPANIGFVARTMACYHQTDLRIVGAESLVASLVDSDQAFKTAKGARDLLQSAKFFPSLADAMADCHFTFGFTRRERLPSQKIIELAEAVALVGQAITDNEGGEAKVRQNAETGSKDFRSSQITQVALVFGRESQGLNRDESLLLSHLVRIPMPDETLSLNLSHAVAIALYAFYQTQDRKNLNPVPLQNQTRLDALEQLIEHLDRQRFYHPEKREAQIEFTKLLWQRLQPNRKELDFILGLFKNLLSQKSGKE